MPVVHEKVAELSNGAHYTYLDNGAPEGVSDYRTVIFVHGTAHNKCTIPLSPSMQLILVTFSPCLDITPHGFRGISISMRGMKGSTPFSPEEVECKVTPSQLHKTNIADFAAFLEYVATQLGVPKRSKDGTGGITTVHWSKGCAVATGLFYYMKDNPSYRDLVDKYISSIVCYEAPTSAVIGLDPGDCANGLFYHRLANPPEDPGWMFAKYVTGFYHNSPEYLANKGGPQCTEYYRSGALEPDFQKYSEKVYEGDYLPAILHWFLEDKEEDRMEACHKAFQEMAASSVKKIGLLWGADGPPECLEGSWIIEKWLNEESKRTGEVKVATKQYPGGNHYIQFYDPAGFWKAILEISV